MLKIPWNVFSCRSVEPPDHLITSQGLSQRGRGAKGGGEGSPASLPSCVCGVVVKRFAVREKLLDLFYGRYQCVNKGTLEATAFGLRGIPPPRRPWGLSVMDFVHAIPFPTAWVAVWT